MDKERCKIGGFVSVAVFFLLGPMFVKGAWLQPVSLLSPGQSSPAGGNGDACLPIVSLDGRFVLFASTANNLVLNSNGIPISSLVPTRFNVYLRDRTDQTTVLISANTNGTAGGDDHSFPVAFSTNGQFALFESSASNLVAGDTNNATDVFVRDLNAGVTLPVSVGTNGWLGNGASRSAVMTPDGRYVAFVSEAFNLVSTDTNKIADVFVRDMQTMTTTLVSVGAVSTNPVFPFLVSGSDSPEITPDGRFVAFSSTATNLVPGVRTVGDIYVHDRLAGTNIWASVGMRPALQSVTGKTNGVCHNLALSADGKFVAYQASLSPLPSSTYSGIILRYGLETGVTDLIHTNATTSVPTAENTSNLDLTPDGQWIAFVANSNGVAGTTTCVQVWDAASGTTTLVSGNLSNAVPTGSISTRPILDSSGRFVAFLSNASGLVTNALPGAWHVYLRDLQAATTTLVDADPTGDGSLLTASTVPSLSGDTRFVAFESADGALVAGDSNHSLDVFVRDLVAGTNELISAHRPTLHSLTPNGPSLLSAFSPSADGRLVAFASGADNLVADDTNGYLDVFVRDMATGSSILVSADPAGLNGNGLSFEPAMGGDGRYVAFTSHATNLATGDTNKASDVFVRDLQNGTTILASLRTNGTGAANSNSYSPTLSTDGRWLLFHSQAKDLASGAFSGSENLFLRDLQAATTRALTTAGVVSAAMTPDGRFVAFVGSIPGVYAMRLYVWDSTLNALVFTNTTAGITNLAISPDGNRLAYCTSTALRIADRAAQTNWLVATLDSTSWPVPRFNADGHWLAYARFVSPFHQTYLYDVQNRAELLLSHGLDSGDPGGGNSDSPDLSPGGRFVAFRTLATNVVADASGITRQIVLYDRHTGLNTLVSASRFTGTPADDHSLRAIFSADGQTLLFQSWASDVVGNDFNHSGDVLAQAIFTAMILPPAVPDQGPLLTWPLLPGNGSRVQFKEGLNDLFWQDLPGSPTNDGWKAWLHDGPTTNAQRFYRVIVF